MKRYSIGKMATMNHISEQTLRLYDRMGLLTPIYVNEDNGYRQYDIRQSFKLDTIQYLKHLGMSLKEIKELYDAKDLNLLQDKLVEEQTHIEKNLQEILIQKQAIQRTLESLEIYRNSPQDGQITLEYIPKRYFVKVDETVNIYDHGLDTYESLLRDFKEDLIKQGIHDTYFINPGSLMSKENVDNGIFYSTELFVFVNKEIPNVKVDSLANHLYLCIYCDSFENEIEYAKKLFAKAKEDGYKIVGDYLCESINDLLLLDNTERSMYLRLQVPVEIDKKFTKKP